MGQQKRPRRLDMAGLQVFWCFCLLGNWPNRYEIGVIKKFIHFFLVGLSGDILFLGLS